MNPKTPRAVAALCRLLACAGLLAGAAAAPPAFPLRISDNARHLVDQAGRPFFYHADTAWMLPLRLTVAEADEYFRVRREQGFTAVQVQLTGFAGMTNVNGAQPFGGGFDFARPHEAFFAHTDAVIARAAAHGLLLAVAPLWAGCCGEGWAGRTKDGQPAAMNVNGPEKTRDFARWLGRRHAGHDHLLWLLGGDNDPGNAREHWRAVAFALKGAAPHQLITYHAASSHSSTDVWPGEPWIEVSMTYTYFRGFNKAWNREQPDVYEVGWEEFFRRPTRPFFLGESTYEGEHDAWGSPHQARKQAYWAVLSGAMGHAYGSPNWRAEPGWREGLQRPGALSLRHLRRLMESRPWWRIEPDAARRLVVAGHGRIASNDHAVAARADDGSFAFAYLPTPRTLRVNLAALGPGRVRAHWFNPRDGAAQAAGELAAAGERAFTPPDDAEQLDWVLVLDDAAADVPPPGRP
jgi:hypothetical protein